MFFVFPPSAPHWRTFWPHWLHHWAWHTSTVRIQQRSLILYLLYHPITDYLNAGIPIPIINGTSFINPAIKFGNVRHWIHSLNLHCSFQRLKAWSEFKTFMHLRISLCYLFYMQDFFEVSGDIHYSPQILEKLRAGLYWITNDIITITNDIIKIAISFE